MRHGHFLVNGKKVDIPSYSVKVGDVVTVRESSRQNASILHAVEEVKGRGVPEWLSLVAASWKARSSRCRRASRSTCRCRNS